MVAPATRITRCGTEPNRARGRHARESDESSHQHSFAVAEMQTGAKVAPVFTPTLGKRAYLNEYVARIVYARPRGSATRGSHELPAPVLPSYAALNGGSVLKMFFTPTVTPRFLMPE